MVRRFSGVHHRVYAPALAILLVSLFFRFIHFEINPFDYDDAYSMHMAIRLLDEGILPLRNLDTSRLFANPPWMIYLQVPLVMMSRSPHLVLAVVSFLNALAAPLVYDLGRRLYGQRAGLLIGLLFAVTPWIVRYSRRPWPPGLYPLLATATAYFLLTALLAPPDRRGWRVLAGLASLGLLLNTSLLGFLAIPQVALLLWLGRDRIPWRPVAVGTSIVVLMTVPFFMSLLRERGFTAERTASYVERETVLDAEALRHAVRLVTGHMHPQSMLGIGPDGTSWLVRLTDGLHLILLAVLVLGAILAAGDMVQGGDRRRFGAAVLAWFLFPVLLMTVHKSPVFPYYLLVSLPAGFLLLGRGVQGLARSRSRTVGTAALAIGSLLVLGANNLGWHAYIDTHPAGHLDYMTLRDGAPLGRYMRSLAEETGAQEIFSQMRTETLTAFAGRILPTSQEYNGGSGWILPGGHAALYVLKDEELGDRLPRPMEPVGEAFKVVNGRTIHFFRVDALDQARLGAVTDLEAGARFANGLELAGVSMDGELRPGARIVLMEYWRVAELLPERLRTFFSVFNRIEASDGRLLAQKDGFMWDPTRWREGDFLVQRYDLHLPEELGQGPFTLRIGTYGLDTLQPERIVGGPRAGDVSVELGLEP